MLRGEGVQPSFQGLNGQSTVGIPELGIDPYNMPYMASSAFWQMDPYWQKQALDAWQVAGMPLDYILGSLTGSTPGYRDYTPEALTY